MSILLFQYPACSTCKKAVQFLKSHDVQFESRHIVDSPPTLQQLTMALAVLRSEGGELKSLFNTSGELYREMKMSERLKGELDEVEALKLLSKHGKLIKRPLVIAPKFVLVGFREEDWKQRLL